MTKGEKTRLVWGVGVVSILWMAAAAWLMFANLSNDELGNHGSSAVKDRMASECFGTFRERYDCKEAIIVKSGRDSFWNLAGRFLVVVVPPFFASVFLQRHLKRNPVQVVIEQAPNYSDWKAKADAQTHAGAAHYHFGPDDQDPHRPLTINDIAPRSDKPGSGDSNEPDWKKKAQSHIKQAKRPE